MNNIISVEYFGKSIFHSESRLQIPYNNGTPDSIYDKSSILSLMIAVITPDGGDEYLLLRERSDRSIHRYNITQQK